MMASASLTLGLIHTFVWMRQGSRKHLAFAIAALSVAALTLLELLALRATEPAQLAGLLRWMHVPVTVLVLSILWFFNELLGPRHLRLGLVAGGLRVLALALNFTTGENLNFSRIEQVRQVDWWGGEVISYAVGSVNPWVAVAQASNVLLIAFVAANLVSAWRRGDADQRRAALVICGSWLFFVLLMVDAVLLMMLDKARMPFLGSPSFLAVILATSYQLGAELSRSTQLGDLLSEAKRQMTQSERDLALAARAGELELWTLELGTTDTGTAGGDRAGPATATALLQRVHADDRDAVVRALARATEDGRFEAEFRQFTAEGRARWMSVRGDVEFDEDQRPRRIRAIARNVSESHAATERFRSLFESAPLALMLVDGAGRITLANDLVAAVFGQTRASLEGSQVDRLVPERHRPTREGLRSAFAPDPNNLRSSTRELQGLRADGSEVSIDVGLKQVEFADGIYTLATVSDVSARKLAEAEAAQQLDELAHLSRVTMIGELSGSLAHELNQPLAAILSNAQAAQRILANDPTDTKDLQEILADIVDDDRRAGEVIRRMRSLLKKGHVDHAPVDVNAVVTDVLRLIRSDMIHRGVDAAAELAPGLAPVDADPVQLQQVLVNLIFNACDAMEGHDAPRVVKVRTLGNEGAVRVSVEDHGPGIHPAMLQRIFEPFETTKAQGMGLGLAVCRSILNAHGGKIWAENVAGGGARVSFEIGRPGSGQ